MQGHWAAPAAAGRDTSGHLKYIPMHRAPPARSSAFGAYPSSGRILPSSADMTGKPRGLVAFRLFNNNTDSTMAQIHQPRVAKRKSIASNAAPKFGSSIAAYMPNATMPAKLTTVATVAMMRAFVRGCIIERVLYYAAVARP